MDKEMLKNLFIALVRSHLEFPNVVWSPRLIKDIKLIEGVQRRSNKVMNDFKKNIRMKKDLGRLTNQVWSIDVQEGM